MSEFAAGFVVGVAALWAWRSWRDVWSVPADGALWPALGELVRTPPDSISGLASRGELPVGPVDESEGDVDLTPEERPLVKLVGGGQSGDVDEYDPFAGDARGRSLFLAALKRESRREEV